MIRDYADNALSRAFHFLLRKVDEFYVIVLKPMFSFPKIFSIHVFISFYKLLCRMSHVFRLSGIWWVTSNYKNFSILHLLRRFYLGADSW